MKHSLIFTDVSVYNMAVQVLALFAVVYETDDEGLTINTDNGYYLRDLLEDEGITEFEFDHSEDDYQPSEDMDGDHASALASAGFGTDEDYEHNSYDEGGE